MPIFLLMLAATTTPCDRVKPALRRAECERKAGHTLEAIELVEEHLAKKKKDKKALKLRDALKAELVNVECFSEPEGALVAVDGEDPAGSTPITLTLDAGKHVFHFTHDGYQPLDREETSLAGTRPKLTAVLERIPSAEPQPAPAPAAQAETAPTASSAPPEAVTEPAPAKPAKREFSNVPLVIGSAGIFIAIGGGVLILTSALAPEYDIAARNRAWAGYGLVGAGVAAGLAAIVWLLIERKPGATDR